MNFHSVSTSYVNMLEEKEIDTPSAPLGAFDQVYDAEEVEYVDEAMLDASQTNGR
jgi:hypothetical protein